MDISKYEKRALAIKAEIRKLNAELQVALGAEIRELDAELQALESHLTGGTDKAPKAPPGLNEFTAAGLNELASMPGLNELTNEPTSPPVSILNALTTIGQSQLLANAIREFEAVVREIEAEQEEIKQWTGDRPE